MKIKHLLPALTLLLLFSFGAQANGLSNREIRDRVEAMTAEEKQQRAEVIKMRVEEIKNMDKSNLTTAEKKELKAEMKMMRKEAKAVGGGGIYISLAGILIIILVLILIL
ncbi:putative Mrr-cat superfamily restriction endonuclease [Filimonas zeae]|uniref:Seryl-tRNA synthetase n=1 Tax=Filimonas zeae TaxID=1737353 RepID=A0A917IYA9_9BACT|nr:hypothetical protein [Filimonas zeae]MDR6340032.1 putative Mrr-cat superfamily restriction endonuclease [Filimonas zeae]GGH70824.1 hypothetical protein GCM10011379_29490 [Filimonas zeae]